jgi:ankyrin repeat protein
MAEALLACGAYVDAINDMGETPLHCAVAFKARTTSSNQLDVVKLLLHHGADIESLNLVSATASQFQTIALLKLMKCELIE